MWNSIELNKIVLGQLYFLSTCVYVIDCALLDTLLMGLKTRHKTGLNWTARADSQKIEQRIK